MRVSSAASYTRERLEARLEAKIRDFGEGPGQSPVFGAEYSPATGYRGRGRPKNSSGQIVPIIGNSLIQTVANSSTIWRGAVVGTFPVSNMKTPSHPGAVSEVRHLASQKDGRVFEVRPGLKFYKPSPGPTLSRRRV